MICLGSLGGKLSSLAKVSLRELTCDRDKGGNERFSVAVGLRKVRSSVRR